MAIVQISRIQHRRGLQQDLPQLASAELGWSLDQRRLFIGNGTLDEGAPSEGVTEVLTQYSNFLGFIGSYTFTGTDSGYTSQTGTSVLTPVTRSLQSVLDETVTVTDFGAKGDGITDDTAAIQRAIQQIYVGSLNGSHKNVQRTIKIPAGTYRVSSPILVPPNCTLVGDGKNNTVITSTGVVFSTADSLYQTGGSKGTNGATLPGYILIRDMKLVTTTNGTNTVISIDATNDATFRGVYFLASSTTTNIVEITSSVLNSVTYNLTFDDCVFDGGVNGIGGDGTAKSIDVINSTFVNCSSKAISIYTGMSGVSSINNYFNGITNPLSGLAGNNYSIGDTFSSGDYAGVHSGNYRIGTGRSVALSNGSPTTIITLGTGSGEVHYQISNSSSYRYGVIKYNNNGSTVTYDDEYTEPSTSLGATVGISSSGVVTCLVSNATSTFKFSLTKFI